MAGEVKETTTMPQLRDDGKLRERIQDEGQGQREKTQAGTWQWQGHDDERNRKERNRQVRTFQWRTRRNKTIKDTKKQCLSCCRTGHKSSERRWGVDNVDDDDHEVVCHSSSSSSGSTLSSRDQPESKIGNDVGGV